MTELEGFCGTSGPLGQETLDCTFNNDLVSVTCSFDGGVAEDCSLPLVLDIVRFGTDEHVVIVTATDEFGQTASVSLIFRLSGRLSHCFF